MTSHDGFSGGDRAKQLLWLIPTALLVLVVSYALYSGQTVEEIGLGGLGTVKFAKPTGASLASPTAVPTDAEPPADPLVRPEAAKQVDHDEMVRRQAELESKLRRMEEALKRSEARPAGRPKEGRTSDVEEAARTPHQADVAGTWSDQSGVSWLIQQAGQAVTFEEYNPILGVTAIGQGTLSGRRLQIAYQSALQTTGTAVLTLSPDGDTMTGHARDHITGASFTLLLHR